MFGPRFFHQTIPPRALIHGIKSFCMWLSIRRENQDNHCKVRIPRSQWDRGIGSRGFNETTGSDSAVSMRPRSDLKIFVTKFDSLNEIHCLLEAAGSDPAVSMIPRDQIPWCQWDRGIESCGFNENAGSDSVVSMRLQKFYDTAGPLTKTNLGSHSL
jgi:hypothetical protein